MSYVTKSTYIEGGELPLQIQKQRFQEPHGRCSSNCLSPKNTKEITAAEFAQSTFFSNGFSYSEYRQVYDIDGENEAMVALHIFWQNNGDGYAMAQNYWDKRVRYFRVGCNHQWEHDPDGPQYMCYHSYVCSKCGAKNQVDSSD